MKKLLLITTAMLMLVSCKKEAIHKDNSGVQGTIQVPGDIIDCDPATGKYNTFYGPAVQMGEGFARSWINITHDNTPLAIGIELTEGALDHGMEESGHMHGNEHILPLHQKAKALTPFDHISANWSAEGHPPPGIYTVPHFDMHFYMIPLEQRLLIPPYPQAVTQFENNPPAGYLPTAYVKAPAGEAKMGAHWMDVLSGEFSGQPFTHTFVYGSYDGKVNFYEPMVTLATLASGVTIQKAIRQPHYFNPTNTYYPTRYSIWKESDRHYVAMDEMRLR